MSDQTQERLAAAICEWNEHEAPAVLREIRESSPNGRWWRYVDETVQKVWGSLRVEAKLVTALAAIKAESMDSIVAERDFGG